MFILYIKILFYERSNFNLPRLYNTKFDRNDLNNFVSVLEKMLLILIRIVLII